MVFGEAGRRGSKFIQRIVDHQQPIRHDIVHADRHSKAAAHVLKLDWEGPDISKQKVPASALFSPPQILLKEDVEPAGGNLLFSWNSTTGQTYRLRGSDTLLTPIQTWPVMQSGIATTPPQNSLGIPIPEKDQNFYVVEEE